MRMKWYVLLPVVALVGCATASNTPPKSDHVESDRRNVFFGFKDFSGFTETGGTNRELIMTSAEITVPVNWDELVGSWNVASNVYLKVEARAVYPDHATKYYVLDLWSDRLSLHPRESVSRQRDADGNVSIDTLVMKRHGGKAQVRLTLGGPAGGDPSQLHYLGLSFCDSEAVPAPRPPNKAAWGRT